MIFFTADEHYGHTNIIQHTKRPFATVEEMNEALIARHNERVGKGDLVYHLGDVTFSADPAPFITRLNGQHYLIKGNHDARRLRKDPGPYLWVKDVATVKWDGKLFFLSHYAHRVWPRSHYGVIHLYGHSHSTMTPHGRSLDVGVDTNDYYPYSAEEIYLRLREIDPKQVDHHAIAFEKILF